MTKKELSTNNDKLNYLQSSILDAYIEIMDAKEYERLTDLASLSNHLAKNSKVAEKEKSSVVDEIRNKAKIAKERRESEV